MLIIKFEYAKSYSRPLIIIRFGKLYRLAVITLLNTQINLVDY